MESAENILWLIGAAVFLLVLSFFGKKAEWFLNFVLRNIMGTIALYFINMGITVLGFSVTVGINIVTVLTVGVLGIPGIFMLYVLSIYRVVQNVF